MSSKDSIVPSEDRHDPDRPPMFSPQQFPGHEDVIIGIHQPLQAEQPHQSYSAAAFYTKESSTAPTGGDIQCRYTRESEQGKIVQRLRDSGQKFITKWELDKLVDRAIEKVGTQEQQPSDADDARFTRAHINRSGERHASRASTLESDRYTISDAENLRDPREFATAMLRTTRLAALANVADKLKIVFDAIAPSLRTDLTCPSPWTTVEGFLKELDACREKWFSRYLWDYDGRSQLGPSQPPYTQYQPETNGIYGRPPSMSGYYFATHQPQTDATYGRSQLGPSQPPYTPYQWETDGTRGFASRLNTYGPHERHR